MTSSRNSGAALRVWFLAFAGAANLLLASLPPALARLQSESATASSVSIVLPPRLVAGQPATLAVFGTDGKLAPNVDVLLNDAQRARTNSTGRVSFIAPHSSGVLIAKAEGASAAALLDSSPAPTSPAALQVASIVSLRDSFPVCASGLRGDANENHAKINVEVSLILAASPECLVLLAPPNMPPGPATISVDAAGKQMTAATTLVSLAFAAPSPPLVPGKKSVLAVQVQGTTERLHLLVSNDSPGVLTFARGGSLELLTSGGAKNFVSIRVTAVRSGDYSFHARLLPSPDAASAREFLLAAAPLATNTDQPAILKLAARLARHPRDAAQVRAQLVPLLARASADDLRTLLAAASRALE
jgi:hypothetical protein